LSEDVDDELVEGIALPFAEGGEHTGIGRVEHRFDLIQQFRAPGGDGQDLSASVALVSFSHD
jgi:hypothetical protein